MVTKGEMVRRLRRGEMGFAPLAFRAMEGEVPAAKARRSGRETGKGGRKGGRAGQKDQVDDNKGPYIPLEVLWGQKRYRFAAECETRSTPKVFREAVAGMIRLRDAGEAGRPLLVVPYLTPEQLAELEKKGVSGIDLCGNGVVVIPGELLIYRTGAPNQYRQSAAIRNVYRGSSSLVGRAFLARAVYPQVNALWREIEGRLGGGTIALSTVSKVLRRMEDDLIVGRESGTIRLLQADKLLENLVGNYQRPGITDRRTGKFSGSQDELMRLLGEAGRKRGVAISLTGACSVGRYAVMAREGVWSFYVSGLSEIWSEVGPSVTEGGRFANLELLETDDRWVYFDRRADADIPWSSPVQTYLELMQGDKREKETAEQVRERILSEIREGSGAAADV